MYIYWYKKKNPQVIEEGTIPWPPFYLLLANLDEPGHCFVITWSWLYFQCVNLFEDPAFQSPEGTMCPLGRQRASWKQLRKAVYWKFSSGAAEVKSQYIVCITMRAARMICRSRFLWLKVCMFKDILACHMPWWMWKNCPSLWLRLRAVVCFWLCTSAVALSLTARKKANKV